jgi:hypothetical protein
VSFVSRWVVGEHRPIERADIDDHGIVRPDALVRWVTDACAAYVARCSTLHPRGVGVRSRVAALPEAAVTGSPARVAVSAGATELLPAAVVVAVRLRFTGGHDDQVVNARCEVTLEAPDGSAAPLGDDVRDELIALEHAATFTN